MIELTRVLAACNGVDTFFANNKKFTAMPEKLHSEWELVAKEFLPQRDTKASTQFLTKYHELDKSVDKWKFVGAYEFRNGIDQNAAFVDEIKAMEKLCGRGPTALRVVDALSTSANRID